MALNLIFDAIIYPISGFRETDSAEDPLGVGRPYNQYLSFVVTETTRLYPLIPIEKQSGDGNFDHCHIVVNDFFVTCGNSPELFDPTDRSFDNIS